MMTMKTNEDDYKKADDQLMALMLKTLMLMKIILIDLNTINEQIRVLMQMTIFMNKEYSNRH